LGALLFLLGFVKLSLMDSFKRIPYKSGRTDNDVDKSIKQICKENGFAVEEHMVTTEDGYILTLFRLPGLLQDSLPRPRKPVVLLQHGLEGDAS
jgi:hypothetical protein